MRKLLKGATAFMLAGYLSLISTASAQTTYSIGGSVSGIAASKSVVLLNNGTNPKSVSLNGPFAFTTGQTTGSTYRVSVGIQPSGQVCTVSNGTGTVGATNVTSVSVTCSSAYSVSGSISGLDTSGLVLRLNSSSLLVAGGATSFRFSTALQNGSPYAVTVGIQPSGYRCSVSNGTGTISSASINNVSVSCERTYTVSGTISGLSASGLILSLNGATRIVSSGATTFNFATGLTSGTAYTVAVQSQPTGLTCSLLNASGTVASSNITNVAVACAPTTYTVGGSVTGLGSSLSLTLVNNGANALTVNGNGDLNFTFSPAVLSGAGYNVTVDTQPTGQNCSVANGSGTVGTQNVTNISVTCVNVDPLTATIVLGTPTTDSIAMKLFTPSQSGTVSVSYGTSSSSYSTPTAPANLVAGTPLAINISGLAANTQYFYRINFQSSIGSSQTPEYKFHTARPVGETFTFAIQADPHMDEKTEVALYQQTLNNIVDAAPDFLVDLGDTFMTEKHQVQLEATVHAATSQAMVNLRYQSDLPYFGIITHSVPLFLVNGNHDAELGWLATSNTIDHSLPTWAFNARQSYFPNPIKNSFYDGENVSVLSTAPRASYYSWKWGDALFIALDPFYYSNQTTGNDGWNLTLGKAQYDWLANTLAVNAGMKYKFVFMHNLVGGLPDIDTTTGLPIVGRTGGSMRGGIEAAKYFEWGGKNSDGTTEGFATRRPGWSQPIHQLLKDNNVTAVFHGHDHLYADQELDGIKYQEVPQPSAGSTANSTTLAKEGGYLSGNIDSSSGYLKISVTPNGVTTDYVRSWLPAGTPGTNNVANGGSKTNKQVSKTWTVNAGSIKYAVGGTISGLTGTVILANNGTNTVTLNANGSFNFSKILASGTAYAVTVTSQPVGQTCSVSNDTGTVGSSNVTNVSVTCSANTFTVGGTISGHTGTVTLTNNGANPINIPVGTTSFTFPAQNYGSNWDVELSVSPQGETCSVSSNGTGTNLTANVTDITVTCGSNTHSIGGTVSGLGTGLSLVLRNNGGDDLTVNGNGSFVFATSLVAGSPYGVTVFTQPSGQTCLLSNASGTVGSANVENVIVTCATNSYTIGGTLSGLGSGVSVVLQNNLGDYLTVSSNGSFTFATPLTSGTYSVTVKTQPVEQICTVTNGSGIVSTNVTNITVSCVTNTYSMQVRVSGLSSGMGSNLGVALYINDGATATSTLSVAYGNLNNTNLKFTPDLKFPTGTKYSVVVTAQPVDSSNSAVRRCVVSNGVGTYSGATVTVQLYCSLLTGNTVGGTVSGLSSQLDLTLSTNYNATLTATVKLVPGSSGFTFASLGTGTSATFIPAGYTYTVTAGTPYYIVSGSGASAVTAPTGQTCTLQNASGTMASSDITNVTISCKYNGYTVGGTISGHTGNVQLSNGSTSITVTSGESSFVFPEQQPGTNYTVSVTSPPTGQSCNVTNGSGTNIAANVTNVVVSCYSTYNIGGTVSGLTGSVTLLNNGNDAKTVFANGAFAFLTKLTNGGSYNVTVQTQPEGQTCLLTNNSGTVSGADVTSILVMCSTNTYTVGGNVTGLGNGLSLVLYKNNSESLTINGDGSFSFATPMAAGPYIVTVGTQPTGQTCSVSNGSGSVTNSNISNITVTCTTNVGGCSSASHANAPTDPFWPIYSAPTSPDVDTTPQIDIEQPNLFENCLSGS